MPRKNRARKEVEQKQAAAVVNFRTYATEVGKVAFDFPWAQKEAIDALQALVRLAERIQTPPQINISTSAILCSPGKLPRPPFSTPQTDISTSPAPTAGGA